MAPKLGIVKPAKVAQLKAARARLPNRRPSHVETLEGGGQIITACIGVDPATNRPCEVFLNGGKEGSLLNSLLDDAGVTISVSLQHGVSAKALAKSIGRTMLTAVSA